MSIRNFALEIARKLPDKNYIRLQYYATYKRFPNLTHPMTFSEKLNWLKLHDRNEIYTELVDKICVRKIVSNVLGGGTDYLVPIYGAWDNAEEIDYSTLPEQFVLKCNHDSGSVIICRDKKSFDIEKATKEINKHLLRNAYEYAREWPYKDVKPKVFAEKYMCDKIGKRMVDYKFYCFSGEPEFLYISEGLEDHSKAFITFYNIDGSRAPFQRADYPLFDTDPILPDNFNEMVDIAKKIAKYVNNAFVRVDLYNVEGKIYFSEITFTPCGGYMRVIPEEWDRHLGERIKL